MCIMTSFKLNNLQKTWKLTTSNEKRRNTWKTVIFW